MKKEFASILVLSLILVSCSTPSPTAAPTSSPSPLSLPWTDRSVFKNGLVTSQQPILDELPGASIYHLEITIAEDLYHVSGREEVQYTNNETVPLQEIELRLFPNILGGKMEVSNITADMTPITPRYELNNSLFILPFSSPLESGKSTVIGMDYQVTVPQSVDQSYGVLAYSDDVLALAHAYPMIAVYNDEGWNAEIPAPYGDITYADASFYLVQISAPRDLTLVASGSRISHTETGNSQTVLAASGPARDFFLAASPVYKETSKNIGEITIRSYAPEEDNQGAQMALDAASKALQTFGNHYAPYPYTEFDIVATPTSAFGIEYPGLVAIASRLFAGGEQIGGTPVQVYLESTVAHEIGHQWFYNLVGDDQLDDPWLDESLAQFATLQYYEDQYGAQAAAGFEQSLEARWARVEEEKIPIGLPVAKYNGTEYGAIVYGRGPLFLLALRQAMGEEPFNTFLKDYTEQLSWKIATPEFLQALAEKHCSCDLDSLFRDWVYP